MIVEPDTVIVLFFARMLKLPETKLVSPLTSKLAVGARISPPSDVSVFGNSEPSGFSGVEARMLIRGVLSPAAGGFGVS